MTFVYILCDPRTDRPHYVGITSDQGCRDRDETLKRRLRGHLFNNTGTERKRQWIAELLSLGLEPVMKIAAEMPADEAAEMPADEAGVEELRVIEQLLRDGEEIYDHAPYSRRRARQTCPRCGFVFHP